MTPEFYKKPAPRPKRDASCTVCGKIVALTGAGQLKRHKNQVGNVCHGSPFNVQPVVRGQVQLEWKGGAV